MVWGGMQYLIIGSLGSKCKLFTCGFMSYLMSVSGTVQLTAGG